MGVVLELNFAIRRLLAYSVQRRAKSWSRCDRNNACFAILVSELFSKTRGVAKLELLVLQFDKTVTSLHHCEMADSLDGAWAQNEHKASIQEQFLHKLWCYAVFSYRPSRFGNVISDIKVAVAPRHSSFQFQCSESASKWILKALWIPNVPIRDTKAFWCCDVVTVCIIQEII